MKCLVLMLREQSSRRKIILKPKDARYQEEYLRNALRDAPLHEIVLHVQHHI